MRRSMGLFVLVAMTLARAFQRPIPGSPDLVHGENLFV